jgi:S1-C subfamily serine protease
LKLLVVSLIALVAGLGAARAQAPAAPSSSNQQIWCYVEGEQLLSRKWPADCKGRIVSDDEAREIQAARVNRLKGAIAPKQALFPGKRMIGSGSGMVVLGDGSVLTNNHVVEHCDAFTVIPADQKEVPAELIAVDALHDLALLRANLPGHGIALFRETEPPPATEIAVIGYPMLGRVAIKPIFREGTVYIGAAGGRPDRFAINMDVRHGNSGGPTVDRFGSVVGVVVAKINTPAVYANTGQMITELGFSIRPQVALAFLRSHGVSPGIGGGPAELPNDKLLDFVSRYVAQVGCWK